MLERLKELVQALDDSSSDTEQNLIRDKINELTRAVHNSEALGPDTRRTPLQYAQYIAQLR